MHEHNPFRYGRAADVLVDRDDELQRVLRIAETSGALFLIGPRRFGKTSILKAAEGELDRRRIVVLRYDAEAYENVGLFAAALLAGAVRKYSSALERAQIIARRFFASLKPVLTIDPTDGTIRVSLSGSTTPRTEIARLTDVLNGIERLAEEDGRRALVVFDEFQQVVAYAGEKAERQIRAVVQTHGHVGYVFAGSGTRMMTEMITSAARAFWQLGDPLYLRPIPRESFIPFLRRGLESTGARVDDAAIVRILDLSEDVPYNVQQLASRCWDHLRDGATRHLTGETVDEILRHLLSILHEGYLQRWLSLTLAQKRTFKIVIEEKGKLQLAEVSRRHGIPRTTMQRALQLLEARHFLRQDFSRAGHTWRLEDPFMAPWLQELQAQ